MKYVAALVSYFFSRRALSFKDHVREYLRGDYE